MNSYGKTWHVWRTNAADREGHEIPLRKPKLTWSFNGDGEAKTGLVENRDKEIGLDSREKGEDKKYLIPRASRRKG